MIDSLIARKMNMTQVFDASGHRKVGTWLEVLPAVVLQKKTAEKDGYASVQLGYGRKKYINKPRLGHLKKSGIDAKIAYISEVKVDSESSMPDSGSQIKMNEVFSVGDLVAVSGVSKGKGFAGAVKRWGFKGGPKTHGQSDRHRAPGSIGAGTTPGRVLKGQKMAGRMGGDQLTVDGLTVLSMVVEENKLLVSGPVPGATNGWLKVVKKGKNEKFGGLMSPQAASDISEEESDQVEVKNGDGENKTEGEKTNKKEEEKVEESDKEKKVDKEVNN